MLDFIRSLVAEVLPQQPKPRKFRRRSLTDRRDAQEPRADEREPVRFGRRGGSTAKERQARH